VPLLCCANISAISFYWQNTITSSLFLAKFLVRFGSQWTKNYLYLTITRLDDPSYMEDLAVFLREVGRKNVAGLLDGVPEQRDLDVGALRIALRGAD
jgi:hypothetical protein